MAASRVSSLPYYAVRTGKLWLERGGTTVLANIRGGGEFGTRWHEAGRREGKRLTHDDFAAVAADLVRRGVTRPGRIAAEGGSNGGLLIANMLTRYPERFGALFCTIPLIDMRRYTQLLAGASWIAEYGDPAVPADWAFLGPISAYHAAEPGPPYPPILLATARRDDRVHPGHARKMAAKLQAMGYDAHFYEPAAGGHGYGKDNAEVAAFSALGIASCAKPSAGPRSRPVFALSRLRERAGVRGPPAGSTARATTQPRVAPPARRRYPSATISRDLPHGRPFPQQGQDPHPPPRGRARQRRRPPAGGGV